MATVSDAELELQKAADAAAWESPGAFRAVLRAIVALRQNIPMTKHPRAGRPELFPTKKLIGFDDVLLDRVETWRSQQKPVPNLSDAIRALIEKGLES